MTALPALWGNLDRKGIPPTLSYRQSAGMAGYTVQPNWSQLQTSLAQNTAGTIVGHKSDFTGSNALDQAILDVRAWNANTGIYAGKNPHLVQEGLLFRPVSGIGSPAWVANAVGSFTATDPNSGTTGTCPYFWKSQFLTYFYNFEAALVAAYDGVPELLLVTRAALCTVFPEPMIRQLTNPTQVAAMNAAGFVSAASGNKGTTAGTDQYMQLADIAAMYGAWKQTRCVYTYNPYQGILANGNTFTDENFTEAAQDYLLNGNTVAGQPVFAGILGSLSDPTEAPGGVANNSGRVSYFPPNSGSYPSMYQHGGSLGTVNHGQTAALGSVGNTNPGSTGALYKTVADFANVFGVGSVELPAGYDVVQNGQTQPPLSPADLVSLQALMSQVSNAPNPPGIPGNFLAVGGNASAALTWTLPSNGGASLTGQTLTPFKAGVAQATVPLSASATSYNPTGLVNGDQYYWQLTATNSAGTGSPATSNIVTPQTPTTTPGAPGTPSFVSGEPESADGSWTAPTSDGGAALDAYVVTTTPSGPGPQTFSGSPPPTAATLVGLTDGQAYTATVHAHNSQGAGPESSASAPFTPAAAQTPPGTPNAPVCSAGPSSVTITAVAAPAGSAPTTSRVFTLYAGGVALPPVTLSGSPPGVSVTVTGLVNGTQYTATFHDVNSVGAGPESPVSNTVTPTAPAPAVPPGSMVTLWTGPA